MMKRPTNILLQIGGVLLLGLSVSSFLYWSTFNSVEAEIDVITVVDPQTNDPVKIRFIDYEVAGKTFESEFDLKIIEESTTLAIHVDKDDPSSYQLAPTSLQKNGTIAVGLLGILMLRVSLETRARTES